MSSSLWPRKLWLLALLLGISTDRATASSDNPDTWNVEGDVDLYGKWAFGCDNLRVCTAIAPIREYDASEQPMHIALTFTDRIVDAPTITIMRDGQMVVGLSPLAAHKLTETLQNGEITDAAYLGDDAMRYDVPREGFAEVMQVIGQWRAMPPQQLNSTELITPFPAVRIENPVIHPDIRDIAKRCPKGHMGSSLQAWGLIGGATLWRAGCGDEGLNSVSFWFVSGPQGAPPEPVIFDDGDGPVEPFNSWFDEASGYLRTTHYFGRWDTYQEDCGIYRAYALGRGGMKLVEKRFMPMCGKGIDPKGWIVTYRATLLNAPDSGP